jgi:hypothetical protein
MIRKPSLECLYFYFIELEQRNQQPYGAKFFLFQFYTIPYLIRHACPPNRFFGRRALCDFLLHADGEFDEEGCAFGFIVPYPDISIVIRDDRVDDGQP